MGVSDIFLEAHVDNFHQDATKELLLALLFM